MWDATQVVLVWCFLLALYIGMPAGWIWNIVKLASQRNAKIAAMSTFRDVLYGRVNREEQENPKEKSPETE